MDELCLSLLRDGQMSYVEDEGYTDEEPIYLVSVNGIELCRVYMSPQAGGEAGFGLEYMSIDKVELLAEFIAPASRSISITAPADATVTLNGITVGESYISSEAPDASVLPELDVVYMLRVQQERLEGAPFPTIREYHKLFGLTKDREKLMKPDAIICHPGPINRGVEFDSYMADHPQRSVILEQVYAGICVRMAILYLLLGGADNGLAS